MKKLFTLLLSLTLIIMMSVPAAAAQKKTNNAEWNRYGVSISFTGPDGAGTIKISDYSKVFDFSLEKDAAVTNGNLVNGDTIKLYVMNKAKKIVKTIIIKVSNLPKSSSVRVIKTADDLKNAILNQADNQTWVIMPGKYPLAPTSIFIKSQNQDGWYFPITANNITIKGKMNPVIYGDKYTPNGNYSTQNLVTVFGNNIKIDGIHFMPKLEVNKTICVEGKNFTITNCIFTPNTITADKNINTDVNYLKDGGALYFSGDKGTVSIKNNIFDYTPVVFDSMANSDSIIIEGNKFTHIATDSYAIGNVTWASPYVTTMDDVIIKNNDFNITDGKTIIKNRLDGKFILNNNRINGIKVPGTNWGDYIMFDHDRYGCTGMQVIVDGVVYKYIK